MHHHKKEQLSDLDTTNGVWTNKYSKLANCFVSIKINKIPVAQMVPLAQHKEKHILCLRCFVLYWGYTQWRN